MDKVKEMKFKIESIRRQFDKIPKGATYSLTLIEDPKITLLDLEFLIKRIEQLEAINNPPTSEE